MSFWDKEVLSGFEALLDFNDDSDNSDTEDDFFGGF